MQKDHITTYTTTIHAPVEIVCQALTDPQMVKKYFFGTHLETTWEVGSPIRFSGEFEGQSYEDKGTILECEPKKKISYSYLSSWSNKEDKPENYLLVTYLLQDNGASTDLSITQSNYTAELAKHSNGNWASVIDGLKGLVES